MQAITSSRVAIKAGSRKAVLARCEVEVKPSAPAAAEFKAPEWIPAQAAPVFDFLTSESFDIKNTELYSKYVKQYAESEIFAKSTGFKTLSETINGRGAMLGFLAGVGAEIFTQKSLIQQLAAFPQPVIVVLAAITFGSVYPIVQGSKGEFLPSLRDTYGLPEGVFTESMERIHGRLAMIGLGSLLAIELVKGSALF